MSSTKKTYALLLLGLSFFINSVGISQLPANNLAEKYYVEHFGEDEGLPQNSINNILPDKNDFLWIATEGGITRFNGNRFLPVAVKTGVNGSKFTRVKGFYYKGNDTIIAYSTANSLVAVIVNNTIVAVEKFGINAHGLIFSNMQYSIPASSRFAINGTDTLAQQWNINLGNYVGTGYNKDSFLVTLNDGIGIYDSKGQVGKIKIDHPDYDRLLYINHQAVYIDDRNYANFYSATGLQKKQLLDIPFTGRGIKCYNNGGENNFFCVADDVLYRIDKSVDGAWNVKKILTSLQYGKDIVRIYEKDSNTIIIGTVHNGLFVYKKQLFYLSEELHGGETDGFYVQQLLPDNETILTGLDKLFKNDRYIGKSHSFFTTHNYSSIKDSKGNYWYVYYNKLLRTKQPGIKPDTVFTFKGSPGVLFEDRDQRVWFSSGGQLGYFKNDSYNNIVVSNLRPVLISCMQEDADGKYLIGTRDGLYVLNSIKESQVKEIPAFRSFDIRFIWPEMNGQTWICTYGQGLFFLSKEAAVTVFPESSGRLAYVHCIVEDARGNFWMPTNSGLLVTSRESLLAYSRNHNQIPFYYRFSKTNGLRTNEFNGGAQPAYLRLPDGDISLASMQGLVRFHPDGIDFRFSASPILIDNIRLDSSEAILQDSLEVPNNINNISFTVSSSFWGQTGNDQLEYQLIDKGKTTGEGRWLPVDVSGKINLFSPSHGNYQLAVRKRKGLKETDYLYKTISFQVLPKWYQTTTFFIGRVLLFLLLLTCIFFWRRNYYRSANRVLTQKVTAATMELQLMNNTLEKKVAERTVEIQEAEIKFRTLVEASLVGVYIVQDNIFIYVNPRFEQILGYSPGELTGANAVQVIKEDQRYIAEENIRLRTSGIAATVNYEIAGRKKDGSSCQLEFFGNSMLYESKSTIIGTMLDITARKIAEEQLIKEKNLSRSIIDSLPGVFFIFDQNRTHLLWNKNFETVTGYSAAEIKQKIAGTCVEERDLALFTKTVGKMYAGGSAGVEVTLVNKAQQKIPFYVNGIAITYEGKPCILGIGIDVSERKKAEQEREYASYLLNERIKELTTLYRAGLVLQEEKKSILTTLNNFVYTLSGGWQYPEITAACITLGELEFATPNFKAGPLSQSAAFITGNGNTGKIEVVYLEERPQEAEGPFLAEERKLINMLADMLQVHLTKREAINALQKSEANLHTIFDTTDTMYALLNENFQVMAFNQRCADFSEKEFKKPFLVHSNFIDYFPQGRQAEVDANIKKVMQGNHVSYEISYPQQDGKLNWYYIRMFPITNVQKIAFGMMIAISDITEKKLLEQAVLDQKVQEQKKVTRAILIGEEKERNKIGQELHDNINQILAGTKLYLGMARKAKENREAIINDSMTLIDSAIEEIRKFSKGKVTPMKKVNLEELLQLLIESVTETSNVRADFIYEGQARFIEDDLKLNIYRIIQEQLNNIIKHAMAKNIIIKVNAGTEFIQVLVTDDGKGFDVNGKKKGIGLSNMINRVESFNGTIDIDSTPGKGCTTTIRIPL